MNDGTLSFQALQLANEQRSAYGLRYNDFTRYRRHCGNRTHRLRSTLKTTHGKGRDFKKLPPLTMDIIKEGHLQLLLFEAERAWAHSQDLVAQTLLPANAEHVGTLRHNATGRFRRAVHWSTQLLSHCKSLYRLSRLKASSLVQATAYTLILNGRFLRYRDDFEDALTQLSVARSLLDELAERAETSRDQALATLFADEIGPEIRYCAHQLGRETAYDVDAIVMEISGKHRGEIVDGCDGLIQTFRKERGGAVSARDKKMLETLVWEGQPVPVRNPELVDVLLKVQDAEGKIAVAREAVDDKGKKGKGVGSKKGFAAYDAILLALSDAEDVARKLLEAQQNTTTLSAAAGGARDIQFVHSYIVYQLLSRRIQRDLVLVSTILSSHVSHSSLGASKTKKGQVDARLHPAVVKLLETVVQSLTQMRGLSIVDDSPDLASAIEARLTYTRARRSFFLAQCYIAVKKHAEALTLVQHATLHVRETHSVLAVLAGITTLADMTYPLALASVEALDSQLLVTGVEMKNEWFAYNGGTLEGDTKAYKKPLFFDSALNYVQLDVEGLSERAGKAPVSTGREERDAALPGKSRLEEIVRAETPEPAGPAKGLGSLLGGWWGRK